GSRKGGALQGAHGRYPARKNTRRTSQRLFRVAPITTSSVVGVRTASRRACPGGDKPRRSPLLQTRNHREGKVCVMWNPCSRHFVRVLLVLALAAPGVAASPTMEQRLPAS